MTHPTSPRIRRAARGHLRVQQLALLLGSLLLFGCADRGGHPLDQLTQHCAGSWRSQPDMRGPGPPPPGFQDLRITIDELLPRTGDGFSPSTAYARGTVAWNGTPWPMTLELDAQLSRYCRYEPGHPFAGGADPDGFHFSVLIVDEIFGDMRSADAFYVDHDGVRNGSPSTSLEKAWYVYRRTDG